MNITIQPLSQSNRADFFDFFDNRAFTDDSPYNPCYCCCFHMTPEEVKNGVGQRAQELGGGYEGLRGALREAAERLMEQGIMQGYLAYDGELAIGWCNANDRQNYLRTGSFNPGKQQEEDYCIAPGEKGKVKAVVCFEIAPEYRGKGIAGALLQRVLVDAKTDGFGLAEVYPQELEAPTVYDFTGPAAMYQKAGFEEAARHGKTIVMRKRL